MILSTVSNDYNRYPKLCLLQHGSLYSLLLGDTDLCLKAFKNFNVNKRMKICRTWTCCHHSTSWWLRGPLLDLYKLTQFNNSSNIPLWGFNLLSPPVHAGPLDSKPTSLSPQKNTKNKLTYLCAYLPFIVSPRPPFLESFLPDCLCFFFSYQFYCHRPVPSYFLQFPDIPHPLPPGGRAHGSVTWFKHDEAHPVIKAGLAPGSPAHGQATLLKTLQFCIYPFCYLKLGLLC